MNIERRFDFSGCSYRRRVYDIAILPLEERVAGTRHVGMKQIVALPCYRDNWGKLHELGPEGKDLVNWCIDFLQLEQRRDRNRRSGFYKHFYEKERGWFKIYCKNFNNLRIINFIRDFLKIEEGYDRWLLNFLYNNNLIDYVSHDIICCWLHKYKPPKTRRHVKKERKNAIFDWIENGPGEFHYI